MFQISYINQLRQAELEAVLPEIPPATYILEIGAGSGQQARLLQERGYQIRALDLARSRYAKYRIFPVEEYDGTTIPCPDASVDVVYSSHFYQYLSTSAPLTGEIRRVVKADGYVVHVLPTASCRFWTMLTSWPSLIEYLAIAIGQTLTKREGRRRRWYEALRAGYIALRQPALSPVPHTICELWTLRSARWRKRFIQEGFEVVSTKPLGLFYTGCMLTGPRLSLPARRRIARVLGSSSQLYVLRRSESAPRSPMAATACGTAPGR